MWVAKTVSKSALLAYAMVPVLFLISMAMIPGFGSPLSIVSLLVIGSLLGIASIGQTLTIVLGGIDLSIPAVIGLANVLTVRWYGDGLPFPLVVLCVLAIALAIGAVNGILSRVLGAHPLLITLAASFMIWAESSSTRKGEQPARCRIIWFRRSRPPGAPDPSRCRRS